MFLDILLDLTELILGYRFQMVSLLKLARVTEEGVRFLSPHDGSPMYVFDFTEDKLKHLLTELLQAAYTRAFHIFAKFNRFGYHHAA